MTEGAAGEVILYQRDDGAPALEVRLEEETVWLSQQQIAELFQTTQQNVSLHLLNIYDEGELDEQATHKDVLLVRREGTRDVRRSVTHYNLDAIISVGYRVKSRVDTQFRIWATERLRGPGSVSRKQAVAHTDGEYTKYRAQLATTPTEVEEAYLDSIKHAQREIEGKK